MSYRSPKSFGADAAAAPGATLPVISLPPDVQNDPAFVAAMKVAQYGKDGAKSGRYPSAVRLTSELQYVPSDVASAVLFTFSKGPVPGSKAARGGTSFDVKLGPEDAKTTVDLAGEIKNGFAVLVDAKPDPVSGFAIVLSKDPKEILKLARAGSSHLVLSIPSDLELATRPGPKPPENRIFGLPLNFKTLALVGGSLIAGALVFRAIKK